MKGRLLNMMLLLFILPLLIGCSNENDEVIQTEVELSIGSEPIKHPIGEVFPDREAIYMTVKDKTFNNTFHLETVNIEGFEYNEGFEYELIALRTFFKNPPADAINPSYSLIEIISKQTVE